MLTPLLHPALLRVQRPAPASPAPQQKLQQTGGSVVQLYRYPGLTASKAKTLLRKVPCRGEAATTRQRLFSVAVVQVLARAHHAAERQTCG